jgi:crotonobetainyl-CoA:carnitine CoA-transferase CaiB-like acyl-CoA transferase
MFGAVPSLSAPAPGPSLWDGDPAAEWARSGVVALTGRPDGPPLVPPGRGAALARSLTDTIGEATADTFHPVRLEGAGMLAERAAWTGSARRGAVSAGGSCRLLPTSDGWAAVSCARPDDPALLGALVGEDLGDDPWPGVASWVVAHSGAQLAERAELLGIAAAPVHRRPALPAFPVLPPRPVDGLLVVDFSALWAGPLCASVLGMAGARVVKVETPQRLDGARRGDPGFYRVLQAGARSVVLDPALPAERRALHALVAAADIVIEASRPRALAGFGLDAAACVASGTTWISITAAGRDSLRVGFGDDVAAGAGLVALDDAGPIFCGDAIADPLTGLTAAALALTAPADGSGRLWDIAMADVVAGTLAHAGDGSAVAAVRSGSGWVVETEEGARPVAVPRRRDRPGSVARPGEHTAQVLGELGIARP